jgi:hypothetical protein
LEGGRTKNENGNENKGFWEQGGKEQGEEANKRLLQQPAHSWAGRGNKEQEREQGNSVRFCELVVANCEFRMTNSNWQFFSNIPLKAKFCQSN